MNLLLKCDLSLQSLTQTMFLICELLTEEPEGGNDMISLEIFSTLYTFLAKLNCGPEEEKGEEKEGEYNIIGWELTVEIYNVIFS